MCGANRNAEALNKHAAWSPGRRGEDACAAQGRWASPQPSTTDASGAELRADFWN